MRTRSLGFFLASLILLSSLNGQTIGAVHKVRIYVSSSGEDAVGQQLAFDLRERVRASQGYELVDSAQKARVRVSLVSLDSSSDPEHSGYSSAVSVLMTGHLASCSEGELVLDHQIVMAGSKRADEIAGELLAQIDKLF